MSLTGKANRQVQRLWDDISGQALPERALLLAIVSVCAVAVIKLVPLGNLFSFATAGLANVSVSAEALTHHSDPIPNTPEEASVIPVTPNTPITTSAASGAAPLVRVEYHPRNEADTVFAPQTRATERKGRHTNKRKKSPKDRLLEDRDLILVEHMQRLGPASAGVSSLSVLSESGR
jgi:hypothetical protein